MIDIIRSDSRGLADHGWLQSRHTFSFAGYHNPAMMGFATLRVVNEDRVQPGQGFGTHPHRDMEIVTYVIEGALEHRDSMGNGSVIRPGELQRMSAGTGITHSEFNQSNSESVHFLQIWILPEANGLEPGYEQKLFPEPERRNRWRLVGSRDGRDGSLTIHQDVNLLAAIADAGTRLDHAFVGARRGFLQVVRGSVELDGETLSAGDAVAMQDHPSLAVTARDEAELLLFDMA
jgi:redox-sensitive bicupin YhaK (pirin superfamily)